MTREAAFRSLITGPPAPKSAPRATWASRMRSTSSSRVGTKRSATETMTARSWDGRPRRLKGRSSLSKPPTSPEGSVVIVRIAALTTRAMNCQVTAVPRQSPSQVTAGRAATIGRPSVKNRCRPKSSAKNQARGLSAPIMRPPERPASAAAASRKAVTARLSTAPALRMTMLASSVATIFTLGSSRCTGESPGTYCPSRRVFTGRLPPPAPGGR